MNVVGSEHARSHHDVGGSVCSGEGEGPLELGDRELDLWEKRVDFVQCALASKGLTTVDRLRHAIEKLEPDTYKDFSYYGGRGYPSPVLYLNPGVPKHHTWVSGILHDWNLMFGSAPMEPFQGGRHIRFGPVTDARGKWAAGALSNLLDDNLISQEDIEEVLGRTPTSDNILYSKGQRVWVKKETSGGLRWRKPHLRVPGYLFGCSGTVERVCGVFSNPEGKVFGVDAKQPLYRVRFRMEDIWMAYRGEPGDTCDAEVYQHWLQPEPLCQDPQAKRPCVRKADDETSKGVEGHSHVDGGDDGHTHEPRPDVEQVAVDKEGEETPSQRLGEAFCRVVISKGLLTAEEIRAGVEAMDRHEASLAGPRIVAKAWADPAFKELLLKDASAACAQIGVNPSNSTAPTVLTAVENTTEVHNLVVCTLCSCYPRSILGSSPDWYKSRSYRARAVLEPRAVLEEFGMFLPPGLRIRVHDSTADLRYFVLPRRPDGTEGWAEEQLAKLVTKDSMIGAAEPLRPSRSA